MPGKSPVRQPARIYAKAPARGLFAFCLLLFLLPLSAASAQTPSAQAVASAHPLATAAGIAVMESGGNAFDAAVAVSAALAVVEPYSSGLGGGGFWLLHRASDGLDIMVDGRERAPLAASRDMYLDAEGKPLTGASIDGALAAGIPGEPAALVHIARKYGRLPLALVLSPAIALAREGFAIDAHYRRMAGFRLAALGASPGAAGQLLVDGEVPPLGHWLQQPDLADTLERLARDGRDGFYAGPFVQKLVQGVRRQGGIWRMEDLAQYQVVERRPVEGHFKGYRVLSAPPPSSGGVVLVEMLNMLEALDLQGKSSQQQVQLITEVMRRAYRDRARYLGDTDYVDVPLERLTSAAYARQLVADIDPAHAGRSEPLAGKAVEGRDTTHFSIIDREGNRVSATLSINYPFGSCVLVPGTGVLLNDEMDDFSIKPGVPNVYGLVGNEANAIGPGKRMLSSMTPTFVESDERIGILGTPGGSRIISMVLIGLLQAVAEQPVDHWVRRARFHHQYLPDEIQFEPGTLSQKTRAYLESLGYKLHELDATYGNMQAVLWDRATGKVAAASDPRGIGAAWVSE